MASQLRVNKSENRSGLGTITYTDTGAIVSGIVTANSFSGDIIGDITGAVTATTGSFSGDVSIAEKIIHTGDTNTFMKFDTDTVTFETAGDERLRIDSGGRLFLGASQSTLDSTAGTIHIDGGTSGGRIALRGTGGVGSGLGEIFAYWNNNKVAGIIALAGADAGNKDDGHLTFYTRPDTATGVQERLRIKSNGQIGVNMAPSADAQFCIKNSDDSNYNVLDVYNDNGNKMGGFSQDSTGNGTIGSRTNAGDLNVMLRSSGNSYFKGGRLLIGTDAHSISSSEMFEVKHATTGFSYFENDNTSGYAPIYINNKGSNSGFAPLITVTDGGGNRAGLGLDSSEYLRITGQGGVEMYTGGTHGGGTQKWRLNNLGDLTHTFSGRHGQMIGSTDGSGAYLLLDGAEGDPLSSGSDYMYMEHTSTGQFEMWNGKSGVQSSKFMDVSPEGYIKEPKQPRFLAYRGSTDLSITGAGTITGWNNVKYDVGSNFSSGTKFTAPVTGTYMIGCNIRWGCNGKIRVVRVQLDHYNSSNGGKGNYGGGVGGSHDYDDSTGYDHPYTSFTNLVEMDAGDYVQIGLQEMAFSGSLFLQAQGFTSNFWGCLMF